MQDDGGEDGRYDPTAGAAPQEPTLAAGAASFIKGITGFIKHNIIPQFDDGSEDEFGRMSRTANAGHTPPPSPSGGVADEEEEPPPPQPDDDAEQRLHKARSALFEATIEQLMVMRQQGLPPPPQSAIDIYSSEGYPTRHGQRWQHMRHPMLAAPACQRRRPSPFHLA